MIKEKTFYPLIDDLLFKEVLCHPDNRKALISFLEIMLDIDCGINEKDIVVKYESILNKTKFNDKTIRSDIIIEFKDYTINLEAYTYFTENSFAKSTTYLMRLFSTNLEIGEEYNKIDKVIQINFVDGVVCKFAEKIISEYGITNLEDLEDRKLNDKFKIKYYRIDKAREVPYNELNKELRWLRFIGAKSREEREELAKGDEVLMELNHWIDEYMFDERTKRIYNNWAKRIYEENAEQRGLEKGITQGIDQGIKQGIKQGITQGIKQGITQGQKEKALKIASLLKRKGETLESISEITELTIDEIKNI